MIDIILYIVGVALVLSIICILLEIKNTRLKNKAWQARLNRMKNDE